MAVYINDTFTTATTVDLSGHTPEVGGAWSAVSGAVSVCAASYSTSYARGKAFTPTSSGSYYLNAAPEESGAPIHISVDLGYTSTSGGRTAGIIARYASGSYYLIRPAGNLLYVQKFSGGTLTTLATGSWAWASLEMRNLAVEIEEGHIKAYASGGLSIDVVDPDPLPAGQTGIFANQYMVLDNFVAETIPPASSLWTVGGSTGVNFTGAAVTTDPTTFTASGSGTLALQSMWFATGYANMEGHASLQAISVAFVTSPAAFAFGGGAKATFVGRSTAVSTLPSEGKGTFTAISNSYGRGETGLKWASKAGLAFVSKVVNGSNIISRNKGGFNAVGVTLRHSVASLSAAGSSGASFWHWGRAVSGKVSVAGGSPAQFWMFGRVVEGALSANGLGHFQVYENAPVDRTVKFAGAGRTTLRGLSIATAGMVSRGSSTATIPVKQLITLTWSASGGAIGNFLVPIELDLTVPPPAIRVFTLRAEESRKFDIPEEDSRTIVLPEEPARICLLDTEPSRTFTLT